jgi:hypothetical protein
MSDSQKELSILYKKFGYPSLDRFWTIIKENDVAVRKKTVQEFIQAQKSYQLHKKAPKIKSNPITSGEKNFEVQMDLLDMSKFSKQNNGYSWILIAVDIFTRHAMAVKLKSKEAVNTYPAVQKICDTLKPHIVASDNGNEFLNNKVQEYFTKQNIIHNTNEPQDHHVLGIIDAFSKTIKNMIYRHFTAEDTTVWIDVISQYIDSYNKTKHSTIRMSPDAAVKRPHDVRNEHYTNMLERKGKFKEVKLKIGDIVRVKVQEHIFTKGYTAKWSQHTHKIVRIQGLQYILDDGTSYRLDKLQKVSHEDLAPVKQTAVQKAHKARKEEIILQQEGVSKNDIVSSTRKEQFSRPAAVQVQQNEAWEVEKIIGRKEKTENGRKRIYLLVKWVGYPTSEATYEPRSTINKQVPELVKAFESTLKKHK